MGKSPEGIKSKRILGLGAPGTNATKEGWGTENEL